MYSIIQGIVYPFTGVRWASVDDGGETVHERHSTDSYSEAGEQPEGGGPTTRSIEEYRPIETVYLPLSYSGNPGVNGVSYREGSRTPSMLSIYP
jgi:hypothetical protein